MEKRKVSRDGMRIKEIRIKLGLTQEEFGKRIHQPQCFISMWESGIRNPSYRSVRQVCDAFGISVYDFYDVAHTEKEMKEDDLKLEEYIQHLKKCFIPDDAQILHWLEELQKRRQASDSVYTKEKHDSEE